MNSYFKSFLSIFTNLCCTLVQLNPSAYFLHFLLRLGYPLSTLSRSPSLFPFFYILPLHFYYPLLHFGSIKYFFFMFRTFSYALRFPLSTFPHEHLFLILPLHFYCLFLHFGSIKSFFLYFPPSAAPWLSIAYFISFSFSISIFLHPSSPFLLPFGSIKSFFLMFSTFCYALRFPLRPSLHKTPASSPFSSLFLSVSFLFLFSHSLQSSFFALLTAPSLLPSFVPFSPRGLYGLTSLLFFYSNFSFVYFLIAFFSLSLSSFCNH